MTTKLPTLELLQAMRSRVEAEPDSEDRTAALARIDRQIEDLPEFATLPAAQSLDKP